MERDDLLTETKDSTVRRAWPLAGRDYLSDTPEARVRFAATTSMAATLVQEVNQPLTAASNYLFAVARRLRDLGEGYEEMLALIDNASSETLRAGEIIRRTRNFVVSGRVTGRRENVRTMVERALLLLNGSRDEGVEIDVKVPLDLFAKTDRIQIEQVLANLLANACAALAGEARPRIVVEAGWQGDEILIQVADNGPGLTPDAPDQLFEPREAGAAGVGLGLAICATIARAHGGRLWAGNGEKGGAVFSLALPPAL
ncbi:MAG TPA: ATP-binding protein [Allosphingosinicella sp.]|nr:ATP-binding protein [Allosphingosinicella sp.]